MKVFQCTRTPKYLRGALGILMAALIICDAPAARPAPARKPVAKVSRGRMYRNVRGQIVTINLPRHAGDRTSAVVDHEAIPDFMAAMRMVIPFQNPADARRLKRGDKIRFDLVLQKGNFFLANIRPLPSRTRLKLAADMRISSSSIGFGTSIRFGTGSKS